MFMDLDALSGVVAYKHTGGDVTTVTAAFDRITIKSPLEKICDLDLSGQVTYVGKREGPGAIVESKSRVRVRVVVTSSTDAYDGAVVSISRRKAAPSHPQACAHPQ